MKQIKGNGFPMVVEKINRNAPCKCNSGKKAKHCYGTTTEYYYTKLTEDQIRQQKLLEAAKANGKA
jgi:uncharacterized protein YecA (UPF0149 family)